MEIRCVKCRFKYDVTINDNQSEATVICPRCGAIQKAVPPHEATETTAGGSSQRGKQPTDYPGRADGAGDLRHCTEGALVACSIMNR